MVHKYILSFIALTLIAGALLSAGGGKSAGPEPAAAQTLPSSMPTLTPPMTPPPVPSAMPPMTPVPLPSPSASATPA
jgi:hypothetical protein